MTTTLNVMEAWSAAFNVYDTLEGVDAVSQAFVKDPSSKLRENFDFSNINFMGSKTGAFIHVKSGFAIIAPGKNIANKNEVLIAIRGTDLVADWLTDANSGLQISKTGKMVHAGFNRVFEELMPQISNYFSHNNPTTVHCVGHSLGGALANLTADWLANKKIANTKLYTFGAPRVGLLPFADRVTQNIGEENIFRVHHDNDFVSLVPLWPFAHTPQPGASCRISNHGFGTFGAHKMENYRASLLPYSGEKNAEGAWGKLKSASEPVSSEREIKEWLSLDTASIISSRVLGLLGEAVEYILKAAGVGVMLAGIAGLTVLDKLSYALELAWKVDREISSWVVALLKKVIQLTGQAIVIQTTVTAAFIRWVFQLLQSAVMRFVKQSLAGSGVI